MSQPFSYLFLKYRPHCNRMQKCTMIHLLFAIALLQLSCACEDTEYYQGEMAKRILDDGYTFKKIPVETKDGYLLNMYRIPHGKNNTPNASQPVVFIMHGLCNTAAEWLAVGKDKALPYFLADAGYDVVLGNARGNTLACGHKTLNGDIDPEFWEFSYYEIGKYDLTAMIDEVLKLTQKSKLYYIGFSQGTTSNYVMLSENPSYNDKIVVQYHLAGSTTIQHARGFLGLSRFPLVVLVRIMKYVLHIQYISRNVFKFLAKLPTIFAHITAEIFGPDWKQHDPVIWEKVLEFFPAAVSLKQLIHYFDNANSGKFRKFDYGPIGNLKRYASSTPPEYNMTNVKVQTHLYVGLNDYISAPDEARHIHAQLPNSTLTQIAWKSWSHADHVIAKDVVEQEYEHLLKSITERHALGNDL